MYSPLMERQLVVPYRSPESKAYDGSMIGRDGEWIAYHTNSYVLGVNTRMVKSEQAPRSYEALLDAKWKDGKMGIKDFSGDIIRAHEEHGHHRQGGPAR